MTLGRPRFFCFDFGCALIPGPAEHFHKLQLWPFGQPIRQNEKYQQTDHKEPQQTDQSRNKGDKLCGNISWGHWMLFPKNGGKGSQQKRQRNKTTVRDANFNPAKHHSDANSNRKNEAPIFQPFSFQKQDDLRSPTRTRNQLQHQQQKAPMKFNDKTWSLAHEEERHWRAATLSERSTRCSNKRVFVATAVYPSTNQPQRLRASEQIERYTDTLTKHVGHAELGWDAL